MSKVYVLVREALSNDIIERKVRTYRNRLDAEAVIETEFQAELGDWNSTYEPDFFECDTNKDERSIYESGRYLENHIDWQIIECPVLDGVL